MNASADGLPTSPGSTEERPILDERLRLGLQLQAIYEPVLDEVLDPRLAELMLQLKQDRSQV